MSKFNDETPSIKAVVEKLGSFFEMVLKDIKDLKDSTNKDNKL